MIPCRSLTTRVPLLPLLLVGVAFAVYANSLDGVFQFDDYLVIVDNPRVHSWDALWSDLARGGIRPLLKVSYTLNWTLGPEVFGFHLLNIALHGANGILLYMLALGLLEQGTNLTEDARLSVSFAAALLFLVHPVQTEAVTYISGRSVALMSVFYLGSILVYAAGRRSGRGWMIFVLSPTLFMLSLAAKEVAVTLPIALLLWERLSGPQVMPLRKVVRYQSIHWGLLLIVFVYMFFCERFRDYFAVSFETRTIPENLLSQINGVTYLLSRLFLVNRLNIDPDLPVFVKWYPVLLPEIALLAVLFGFGIFSLRKRPWLSFGIFWFFLHLLPTNSFVPRIDIANERALYLADWGLFLPLCVMIFNMTRYRVVGAHHIMALHVLLCLVLLGYTIERNRVYKSEVTLWEDTTAKSPLKLRPHYNLGYAYSKAGRYEEARGAYSNAFTLDPGTSRPAGN